MTHIVSWPSNTTEIIDDIRFAIGRLVDFYTIIENVACTGCSLDPVTNTSVNSFCPICSGTYWIPVWSGTSISGHITWAGADIMGWAGGGQYFDGDVRVQIKKTDEYLTIVDQCQVSGYVIVDNKVMTIRKRILRGVQNLNRILIDMIEKEQYDD
jgi:hypothetical protein